MDAEVKVSFCRGGEGGVPNHLTVQFTVWFHCAWGGIGRGNLVVSALIRKATLLYKNNNKACCQTQSTSSWSNREQDATLCHYWSPCELCGLVTPVSKGDWAPVSWLGKQSGGGAEYQQGVWQLQSQGDDLCLDPYLTRMFQVHWVGYRSGENNRVCIASELKYLIFK